MKKAAIYFITIFCLTILISCGGGKKEDKVEPIQETPDALQDSELEIKSYNRFGDLTDELYQELVDKNPALKQLEDDLNTLNPKLNEQTEKFNKYDSKSNSYYTSANNKSAVITDTILKNKIIELIKNSSEHYSYKTTELNSLLKQISLNNATINDHHTVLKIVLTLPLIEKYQNDNLPNKKEFKDLIKNQEVFIKQTDSLTPKY